MKNILTFAAAAVASSFISVSAHAMPLDFVAEAAGNERGITSGTILNIGGVNVQFTSNGNPYFDDVDGAGNPAGLGVCQTLDSNNQCNPGSDDNITSGEWVQLDFVDGPLDITSLSFRAANHDNLNDDMVGQLSIIINGGAAQILTFASAVQMALNGAFTNVSSIRFDFVDTQFYISGANEVPIPGAIPLLLSGIAGLGFASRKKKKA